MPRLPKLQTKQVFAKRAREKEDAEALEPEMQLPSKLLALES
jgi:hypothetical protein